MSGQTKVDRLYIDKKDIELYNRLKQKDSPYSGSQNKDLFISALVIGFNEGARIPITTRSGFVHERYLKEIDKSIINAIAVNEEDRLDVLLDKKKIFQIAEEYANGGVIILKNKIFGGEYGSYAKKMESELLKKFDIIENIPDEVVPSKKLEDVDIKEVILEEESNYIEFKSSILYGHKEGKNINKLLAPVIAKTISSFMNSKGGFLVLGVDNNNNILGLEHDYNCLKKKNRDGYELHLTNITNKHLGKTTRQYYDIKFDEVDGKDVAVVGIEKANRPIYCKHNQESAFYIRSGNSCQPLDIQDANLYIKENWPTF